MRVSTRIAVGKGGLVLSTRDRTTNSSEERSVETRVEVCWSCTFCAVGGRDAPEDGADPCCWNCGGPVVVTARPTIRSGLSPDTQ
jgi:hypothetical protein